MELLKQLGMWLAFQLDKLKRNVFVFLLLQAVLSGLALAFANDVINVPTPAFIAQFLNLFGVPDLDTVFTVVLATIVALNSPRTTQLKQEFLKMKSAKKSENGK